MPNTSIIIPNFNGLKLLRDCVASIRRHTPTPYEIIVVDNGSTDGSVEYCRRMLKIDRAFVQELDKSDSSNSTTVVAAILALAHALNIQVIAEGIETQAQLDALVRMGCEMGQGYLLGSPAPISHWVAQGED